MTLLDLLPDSFRVGIVTLIHKKYDETDLKNWRPITLLNAFCKHFRKLLATRLYLVLGEVIHLDQACAIIAWVGLLYQSIRSKILVNGQLITAVNICCGFHQGCPLYALLYLICVEPLAQILRRDKWMSGMQIPGSWGMVSKCLLYMDDGRLTVTKTT